MKQLIWYGLVLVGLLVVISVVTPAPSPDGAAVKQVSSILSSEEAQYDFGNVSMANGLVTHEYQVSNNSDQPILIDKMFTSCMCTEAELAIDGKVYGSFGMPGHGLMARQIATLAPGQTATVTAKFDPAAHGPAGVGMVDRMVTLVDADGGSLDLGFKAMVTP